MTEYSGLTSVEQVKKIIVSKNWYDFDENGIFSWELSLKRLGKELRIDWQRLGEIFASCFSSDTLTKVKRSKNDSQEQEEMPLLTALKNDGFSFYLWSEGDKGWQKEKFKRTGANQWISEDDCFFFPQKKEEGLPEIVDMIFSRENGFFPKDVLMIIIDDKEENLVKAREKLKKIQSGIQSLTYHFKIKDQQADANAFYLWLQQVRRENPDKRIELILDFDNVVIDTNGVLSNVVPENILRSITFSDNLYSTGAVEKGLL